MNKSFVLTFFLLIKLQLFAQIVPFGGIFNLDTCAFENSCNFIRIDSTNSNFWQIGKVHKTYFDSSLSGNKALITDTIKPYENSQNSFFDLIIDWISSPIVSFYHKYDTDSFIDGGYIELSFDNGMTWQNIIEIDSASYPTLIRTENFYSISDTLINKTFGFSGQQKEWQYSRFQLVWAWPAKFYPDSFIARFNFISDSVNTHKNGWMIDRVELSYADLGGSVNNQTAFKNLAVYPNPTRNLFSINFSEFPEMELEFKLFNQHLQEQEIRKTLFGEEVKFDVANFCPGIYFLQIFSNEEIISIQKILKIE